MSSTARPPLVAGSEMPARPRLQSGPRSPAARSVSDTTGLGATVTVKDRLALPARAVSRARPGRTAVSRPRRAHTSGPPGRRMSTKPGPTGGRCWPRRAWPRLPATVRHRASRRRDRTRLGGWLGEHSHPGKPGGRSAPDRRLTSALTVRVPIDPPVTSPVESTFPSKRPPDWNQRTLTSSPAGRRSPGALARSRTVSPTSTATSAGSTLPSIPEYRR